MTTKKIILQNLATEVSITRGALSLVIEAIDKNTTLGKNLSFDDCFNSLAELSKQNSILQLAKKQLLNIENNLMDIVLEDEDNGGKNTNE